MKTMPLAELWFPNDVVQAVAGHIQAGFVGPGPTSQKLSNALATHAPAIWRSNCRRNSRPFKLTALFRL